MFKIKLLILFLINFGLIGCVSSDIDEKQFSVKSTANDKFFLYENTLIQYLDSMGLYNDLNYDYLIKINPNKTEGVFITNIDKNSDRKRISLDISYTISKRYYETSLMCDIFSQDYTRGSSYIIASGEFNISNIAADEEIQNNLIDIITNDFIDDLIFFKDKDCKYKYVRER
tara:strand:- start:1543 stop:2058 length:516 start_codon:yes stop_codon:yes gene_type:complete